MTDTTNNEEVSLGAFADQETEARFVENQDIARALRVARTLSREHEAALEEIEGRLSIYERLDASRLSPPKWLVPTTAAEDHVAIPSMLLTDIHWGEKVEANEIGGINSYTVLIAQQRVRRAFEKAILVSQQYWSGVRYEGFNLMLGGDILSGIIHEELRETNEESVFASILGVVEVLTAGCVLLAEQFPKLHIAAVVGNHGRLTRKPRAKHKVEESLDWMVYQMLGRELAKYENVTMQVAESADCRFEIYNTKYCLTHGDQFRGGSGIAAALSPLLLGAHRKLKRDAAAGNPFDVLVMGHWHYSYTLQDLIVGGSVVGYNEYAYVNNLAYQSPRAQLWLTTPEYGITSHCPLFVQDREQEGW